MCMEHTTPSNSNCALTKMANQSNVMKYTHELTNHHANVVSDYSLLCDRQMPVILFRIFQLIHVSTRFFFSLNSRITFRAKGDTQQINSQRKYVLGLTIGDVILTLQVFLHVPKKHMPKITNESKIKKTQQWQECSTKMCRQHELALCSRDAFQSNCNSNK